MKRFFLLLAVALAIALAAAPLPIPVQGPQTGLLFDDVFLRHLDGVDHPEQPARLTAIRAGLERAGLFGRLTRISPRRVTDEELMLVHSRAYVDLVRKELSGLQRTTDLSTGDTVISPGSFDTAQFATGGVLNAVDAVMTRKVKNAFCAVRPPGHHATPSRGMGFCIYNHVAVAARYAQKMHGVKRVLIVDWDYHHGNGTQDIFYDRVDVAFASIHADPATDYPFFWGHSDEAGAGEGEGATLNLPLPRGTDWSGYAPALAQALDWIERHGPDLLVVSFGADTYESDPISNFKLKTSDYAPMARRIASFGVPTIVVMEGGYAIDALGPNVGAFLSGF